MACAWTISQVNLGKLADARGNASAHLNSVTIDLSHSVHCLLRLRCLKPICPIDTSRSVCTIWHVCSAPDPMRAASLLQHIIAYSCQSLLLEDSALPSMQLQAVCDEVGLDSVQYGQHCIMSSWQTPLLACQRQACFAILQARLQVGNRPRYAPFADRVVPLIK